MIWENATTGPPGGERPYLSDCSPFGYGADTLQPLGENYSKLLAKRAVCRIRLDCHQLSTFNSAVRLDVAAVANYSQPGY